MYTVEQLDFVTKASYSSVIARYKWRAAYTETSTKFTKPAEGSGWEISVVFRIPQVRILSQRPDIFIDIS